MNKHENCTFFCWWKAYHMMQMGKVHIYLINASLPYYLKSVDKCKESSLCLKSSHIQVCDQINHPNSSCHKLLKKKIINQLYKHWCFCPLENKISVVLLRTKQPTMITIQQIHFLLLTLSFLHREKATNV